MKGDVWGPVWRRGPVFRVEWQFGRLRTSTVKCGGLERIDGNAVSAAGHKKGNRRYVSPGIRGGIAVDTERASPAAMVDRCHLKA